MNECSALLLLNGLSFSNHATCADHAALTEVVKACADNGGRILDATHASNPDAEQFQGTVANELGIQGKVFWSTRGTPAGRPQPAAARAQNEVACLVRGAQPVTTDDPEGP